MAETRAKQGGIRKVLILGGGFAGINALMELEKQFLNEPAVEITMVSRENYCLFTPMLSEVAIGTVDPRDIVTPIRELCYRAKFHRGEVLHIDFEKQAVDILYNNVPGCPDTLHYDHLVLAMGSTSNLMLVPGVEQYALKFKEVGDALFLRNHLLEVFERADVCPNAELRRALLTFAVIGGGYSGVEIAAAIAGMAKRVLPLYPSITKKEIRVLVVEAQERILSTLPETLSQYAREELEERDVEVILQTRLDHVEPNSILLSDGQRIETYSTVWTTGIVIPPLLQGLPVEKDAKSRPLNTSFLQLPGHANVWGIGDNILTPLPSGEGYYPATAQVAVRQGRHVAENIKLAIYGHDPMPFDFVQVGEMVVLGEYSAVALIKGVKLKGFIAWVIWRGFYLMQLPRWRKKVRVAIDWILDLFGPVETTQIKSTRRIDPCDIVMPPTEPGVPTVT